MASLSQSMASFIPRLDTAHMPPEIVDKLNKAVNAGLKDSNVKAHLAEWGATALAGSPADFAKFVTDETEKWGKVIRAANIKAE